MSVGRRRFRIIKEIAEGGFGKVYLAEQISSDGFSRIVAVKLLHAKWSSHDEVVMRTRDEARVLGRIRHQHIVKVEDLTAIDGKCAIVMEYLEGVDLKWMIQFLKERDQIFPRAALFEIILAVASALDAAYNARPLQGGEPLKVIHRDIKPSNVFVTVAGGVKVLDFGTARANFAEREAKTQALAFGSQGYMAPERMLGEEDTPAADIFSLGITLYELLTLDSFGRIPPRPNKFQKKIEERVAAVPLEGDPEWVSQVRDTLRLMLSYDPKDRPTAAQLVEIMEILAQDASDMGLRRYCRTLVAEAKAALPDLDTGDPLTGTIVDEDASASYGAPPAGGSQPPSVPDQFRTMNPGMVSNPGIAVDSRSSQPGMSTAAMSSYEGRTALDPAPTSRRGLWLVVGGLAVLGVGAGLVAVVLGLGTAVVVSSSDVAVTDGTVVPDPAPVVPVPPTPPPVPVKVGGTVVSPDSRTGPKVATLLKFGDPVGGSVEIKGPGNFKAEWDGKADFAVGDLGEGSFAANVTTADGTRHRLKKFQVDPTKKACEFTFDPAAGDWKGGCK